MDTNHLPGPGCYKRAKAHLKAHIDSVRDIMFKAATEEVEESLTTTVKDLRIKIEEKTMHIVRLIEKDYRALLADGNIFKALSAARDELRDLLAHVGERFENERDIYIKVEDANPSEQMAAMNVGDNFSASADEKTPVMTATAGLEIPAAPGPPTADQLPTEMAAETDGAALTPGQGTSVDI